jgi:2-oxoglutarate ferredoxin oxidoreductase subunit delta
MSKVKINKIRCKGCSLCVVCCPKKNLKLEDKLNEAGIFTAVVVDENNCTGCGFCFIMCPDVAIEIEG